MFIDASNVSPGHRFNCDVVVVGSGASGITVACELAGSGLSVILLEAGGKRSERETQELYAGEVDTPKHHGPLTQYRQRMWGGTTTVWGGRCGAFDPIDFEKRDYVPFSGWPVTREEMNPFYARAHAYTHTGEFSYDVRESLPGAPPELIPGLKSERVLQDQIWRFSLPTNFGRHHMDRLRAAANVQIVLHGNCLKVQTNPEGDAAVSLEVAALGREPFFICARAYVLAAGGLESTRLLFLSNEVRKEGLGNEHDLLGRFYSSHIAGDLGEVTFLPRDRPVVWQYEKARDGVYCKRNLRISAETQRQLQLMNFRCILTHPPFGDFEHGSGVLSAVYLVKRFFTGQIPPEYSGDLASREYRNVGKHMKNLLLDSPNFARFAVHWLFRRILAERKFPSVALRSASNSYTIHFDAEQTANPDSRVTLGTTRDAFGMNRLSVQWRFMERDLESVAGCHRVLKQELERDGIARLHVASEAVPDLIRDRVNVGSHHIGTTRMSDDPKRGVVNADCRLHSVSNLYIAAPSVFCTPGFANPVLTTVAFAVRLADHLKTSLARPEGAAVTSGRSE